MPSAPKREVSWSSARTRSIAPGIPCSSNPTIFVVEPPISIPKIKPMVMDPGYAPENRRLIKENAARLEIPVTIFDSDIFDVTVQVDKNPCYLCARMRRGFLYAKAQELGCNKIALGHHFSDVIETTLMALLYGAQIQTMPPKLHSKNFPGMATIASRTDRIKAEMNAANVIISVVCIQDAMGANAPVKYSIPKL